MRHLASRSYRTLLTMTLLGCNDGGASVGSARDVDAPPGEPNDRDAGEGAADGPSDASPSETPSSNPGTASNPAGGRNEPGAGSGNVAQSDPGSGQGGSSPGASNAPNDPGTTPNDDPDAGNDRSGGGNPGSAGSAGAAGSSGGSDGGIESEDSDERLHDFCEEWVEAVCVIEVACCTARGFEVATAACTLPELPLTLPQQPRCAGRLVTPEHFDEGAARACLDLQPELLLDCHPARRDSAVHAAAVDSCEQIAPEPRPEPGDACAVGGDPCEAPTGMASVCYYEPGSGGLSSCSPASPAQPEGASCGGPMGCEVGLVCNVDQTCGPRATDGEPCAANGQCLSGHCNGTCAEPPPIADTRCETLQRLTQYALYIEEGVGTTLTVTEQRLVWPGYSAAHGESVHHAPKDGAGPVVHLAPEGPSYSSTVELFADDDYVYDIVDGVVDRMALSDGSRQVLADVGFDGVIGARRGSDLFVVGDYCGRLTRVSVDGSSIEVHPGAHDVLQSLPTVHVTADDEAVYCANGERVTRFGHAGDFETVSDTAVETLGWVASIQAVNHVLYYWASGDQIDDQDRLRIMDPGTGEVQKVQAPERPQSRMVADPVSGELFWTVAGGFRQFTPGTGEFLLIEPPVPTSYAVSIDQEFFYWRHEAGIYRWPRP